MTSEQFEPTAIGIGPPDGSFNAPPFAGWTTMDSDIAARMYRNDMQLMFNFGAGSAIRAIKGTMANFEQQSTEEHGQTMRASSGAALLILEPIEQEIYNLLTLSVQGHSEKAFRRWLRNSLEFTDQTLIVNDDIIKAQWSNPKTPHRDLGFIMKQVRGIHINDVPEGPFFLSSH